MAQSPQTTQELLDATALNEARAKYLASQKALAAAQQPDPAAEALAAATQASNIATAKQATAAANAATLKTRTAVPDSGYTGGVAAGSTAGVIEAQLLASQAVNEATAAIVKNQLSQYLSGKTVALYTGTDLPNFYALTAFRAQVFLLHKALVDAKALLTKAKNSNKPFVGMMVEESVEIAGAALDAANKLIGFFRTDYTINGVDVKLDDLLVVNGFAGNLLAENKGIVVRTPAVYNPPAAAKDSAVLLSLQELSDDRGHLEESLDQCVKLREAFAKTATKEEDGKSSKNAEDLAAAISRANAAVSLYEAFLAKLGTADDKGVVPLGSLMQLDALNTTLADGGFLLSTKLTSSGGSYYTRKNMWTFFGGMPFFNMGGVVVTYSLLDGATGKIVAAGVLPVDGGYVKNNKLQETLRAAQSAAVSQTRTK